MVVLMFRRKPTIKDATNEELFKELAGRLGSTEVTINGVSLHWILSNANNLIKIQEIKDREHRKLR